MDTFISMIISIIVLNAMGANSVEVGRKISAECDIPQVNETIFESKCVGKCKSLESIMSMLRVMKEHYNDSVANFPEISVSATIFFVVFHGIWNFF